MSYRTGFQSRAKEQREMNRQYESSPGHSLSSPVSLGRRDEEQKLQGPAARQGGGGR